MPIGDLVFPRQDPDRFDPIQNVMKFHSTCALPDHAPLGMINHIRAHLYAAISEVRVRHIYAKKDGPQACPFGF